MTAPFTRRVAVTAVGAVLGLAAVNAWGGAAAVAQTASGYPNKTVTIIVPFPPGGTTDIITRLIASDMSKTLAQTIIIDNKPGANGNIGSAQVAKAAPDGYTLLATGIGSNAINHGLYTNMPFDSRKDFAHIAQLSSGPNVLVLNADFPAKNFAEWLELVKKDPGKYTYASAGNGASGHMAMELLKLTAGLKMTHIPYRGGAPAFQDVLAGHVPFMFINQDMPLPQVKAGTMRVIAAASPARNPSYPDVPTVAEGGFPGFAAVSWVGLAAPANTPKEIVDALNAAVAKAVANPNVKETLLTQGFIPGSQTPAEAQAFVGAEMDKWMKVAKDAGVKLD